MPVRAERIPSDGLLLNLRTLPTCLPHRIHVRLFTRGQSLMKSSPLLAAAILMSSLPSVSAADCCRPQRCQPCGTASATQWYTAKDGTLREKMPYRQALSRAEDADDMEIELRGVREELTAAQEASTQATEAHATELAALRKQLEEQVAATKAANDRAATAEAANAAAESKVAELTAALEQSKSQAAAVTAERDAAKAEVATAATQIKELTAERDKLLDDLKNANGEIERLKQEAAESKKAALESEDAADEPSDDTPAEEEQPAAEEGDGEQEPAAE